MAATRRAAPATSAVGPEVADLDWMPAILAGGAFGVALLVLLLVRMREHSARKNSPFADEFLRAPGHSMRNKTESAYRALWRAILVAVSWPLLVYGAWASLHLFTDIERSPETDLVFAAVLLLGFAWAVTRLFRAEHAFRRLRLSLDGEIATGQMLAGLIGRDCRLVHDVGVPGARIAHVLLAPAGVVSIRTMARHGNGRGKEGVTVHVEGNELRFPDGSDKKAVPLARRQAQLLAAGLQDALGYPVQVRPAVALPGWLVERRGVSDVAVFNPRDAAKLLAGPVVLPASELEEIVGVLEGMGPGARRPAPQRSPELERREPRLD